ncbi:hypothetical protein [Serratia sp. D1N4]
MLNLRLKPEIYEKLKEISGNNISPAALIVKMIEENLNNPKYRGSYERERKE